MEIDTSVVVHEKTEHSRATVHDSRPAGLGYGNRTIYLLVLLIASSVYLTGIISPPSIQDDSDAVLAQAARTMLETGDWVTPHLDGVPYLEKPALQYWMMTVSYKIFGVHDWSARLPYALFSIGLCLLTTAFGIWAFGRKPGFYAGMVLSTCAGLYLFTRIVIPDVVLTFTIALAMWALLRVLDEEERHPRAWAFLLAASLGVGLLLKSLIAVVFPLGAGLIYLFLTRQLFQRRTWQRLHPFSGALIVLAIAAPWHILATLRNPPYFSLSMHSGPGEYHGFLWFFFINEQLLRFLNLRYPRDYNTVPRLYFWLFHLIWLFPWSVYFPAIAKLSFKPLDRAGRTRLLALCWIGFVMVFFTFSTTQEYYSMPIYPALALLLGSAMALNNAWIRRGTTVLTVLAGGAAAVSITILVLVRHVATPGDIFSALTSHPSAYTLSLGRMEDLTLQSFAYLRVPLALVAVAFLIGAIGTVRAAATRAFACTALMMLLFFQAARIALVNFDPDLSSRPLAEALLRSPEGKLILDRHYYAFSSVVFYTDRPALLLNGRKLNLSYGSYAPGAPNVFIDDQRFKEVWLTSERYYLVADNSALRRLEPLVGRDKLNLVAASGGKFLATNLPLPNTVLPPDVQRAALIGRDDFERKLPSRASTRRPADTRHRLASTILGSTNPAIVAQTRYILLGRNLLAIHSACFPKNRVDHAVREPRSDGSSSSSAALHCMSPEEDA